MKIWWGLCWLAAGLGSLPIVAAESKLLNSLSDFPDCAVTCFTASVSNSSCSTTNDTCLCNDPDLNTAVVTCLESACTIRQTLFTQNLTMTLCDTPIRNNSNTYRALSISLLVISGLFVVHRVIIKKILQIGLGSDDWVMIATVAIDIASTTIIVHGMIGNGFGRDLYTLTAHQITSFLRYFQGVAILYFIKITLLKASILLFYLRIFPTTTVRYILWGIFIFNALVGVTYVFVTIFMCQPISYFWNQWDKEHHGRCADLHAITTSNAAISIFTDVIMLLIPLFQVKALNLDWKKKIGIGLMFCIGTFVTILSVIRFSAVANFGNDNKNPTWDYMPIVTWSLLEVDLGIICACMPAIRTLFSHLFQGAFGSIGRSSDRSNMDSHKRRSMNPDLPHPGLVPPRIARQSLLLQSANSDNDEINLVGLRDLDKKSSKSDVSI